MDRSGLDDESNSPPSVQLQPWARIEGVVFHGSRPAANIEFILEFSELPTHTVSFDVEAYRPTSDPDWHFSFTLVPPVPLNLFELVDLEPAKDPGRSRSRSWTDRPLRQLKLKPGETH